MKKPTFEDFNLTEEEFNTYLYQKELDKKQTKEKEQKIDKIETTIFLIIILNAIISFIISFTIIFSNSASSNKHFVIYPILSGLLFIVFPLSRKDKIRPVNNTSPTLSNKVKPYIRAMEEYNSYLRMLSDWAEQEEEDKKILSKNTYFAQNMLSSCEAINLMWEADCSFLPENSNSFARSKRYLKALTPELFIDNYYAFKSLDHDTIKNKIYKERPYLVHETFINMGKYIFETNNQIKILEYLIAQDDFEYSRHKTLAEFHLECEKK